MGAGIAFPRRFISPGTCSWRMLYDISGVHVSTAAENVCLRQTHATVGSPKVYRVNQSVKAQMTRRLKFTGE